MKRLLENVRRLIRDEQGATAIEYGLIIAAIGGLIVLVVFELGSKINNSFQNVAGALP